MSSRRKSLLGFLAALLAACVLVSTLPIIQRVSAAQNTLDTDSFGGVNADTLSVYNSNWVPLSTDGNALMIRGTPGVGANSNIGQELRNGFTWTNDQWVGITLDGTTLADARDLIGVRCTQGDHTTATGYLAGVNRDLTGGTYEIYKIAGTGSFTLIQTSSTSYAVNDIVNFQVVGTTLTLLVNNMAAGAPVTDATYATGSPCMMLGHSSTARLAGTWKAGSVSAAASSARRSFFFGIGP